MVGWRQERQAVIFAEVNYQSWEICTFFRRCKLNRTQSFLASSCVFYSLPPLTHARQQSRHTCGPIQQSLGLAIVLDAYMHTGSLVMDFINPSPLKRGCLAWGNKFHEEVWTTVLISHTLNPHPTLSWDSCCHYYFWISCPGLLAGQNLPVMPLCP